MRHFCLALDVRVQITFCGSDCIIQVQIVPRERVVQVLEVPFARWVLGRLQSTWGVGLEMRAHNQNNKRFMSTPADWAVD